MTIILNNNNIFIKFMIIIPTTNIPVYQIPECKDVDNTLSISGLIPIDTPRISGSTLAYTKELAHRVNLISGDPLEEIDFDRYLDNMTPTPK